MLPARMARRLLIALSVPLALAVSGCGEKGIELAKDDPYYDSAVVFQQRCAGCHNISAVNSEGSAVQANSRERKDGPNFDTRKEDYQSVLYALRNGGFSSGPMPQNIVVGDEAEMLACFVAKYSGSEVARSETPGLQPPTDTQGGGEEATSQSPEETGANCPE